MSDVEIVRKDDGKLVAVACPGCGTLYQVLGDDEARRKSASDAAAKCCPPRTCSKCKERKVERGAVLCAECGAVADAEAEAARFAAATKAPEAEWTGPVWWPRPPFASEDGSHYWPSVAKLRADVAARNAARAAETPPGAPAALPPYVWATRTLSLRLDMTPVVAAELAEYDDSVEIGSDKVAELQAAADAWCAKQGISSFEEDLSKAVVLG
jgi:hypothetical protein